MKKPFLNFPPAGHPRFAPRIKSRSIGLRDHENVAYRSDGKMQLKTDGLEGDNLKFVTMLNSKLAELPEAVTKEVMLDEVKSLFKDMFGEDGKLNVTFLNDVKAFKEEMDESKEGSVKSILKEVSTQVTELKNRNGGADAGKSITDMLEEHKDEFAANTRKKGGQVVLELKTAAVTTTTGSVANNATAASALRIGDGPIVEIMRGKPFVLSFLNVGNTDAAVMIWFDEVAKEGDFAITAEGQLKPMLQYKFVRQTTDYKKAAGYTVLTDEFMMDFPKLVTTIKRLMQIDCMNDMNAIILADLLAFAPTYVYTGLNQSIDNPDDYAAIGAAIAQIQSLYFTPNVLVINVATAWRLKLEKDDNGRYQMPPMTFNGTTYEFGNVIVDPRMPDGKFLVADGMVYNVDLRGDIIVRIGYANDDLLRNQQSLVVEQFFFNYGGTNTKGAMVLGDFDVIKDLIAKP